MQVSVSGHHYLVSERTVYQGGRGEAGEISRSHRGCLRIDDRGGISSPCRLGCQYQLLHPEVFQWSGHNPTIDQGMNCKVFQLKKVYDKQLGHRGESREAMTGL